MKRKLLMVHSDRDGPWVPVSRLMELRIQGAGKKDKIIVEFRGHDLQHDPDPLRIQGSGTKFLNFPKGEVRVRRLSGNSPLTVMAFCERFQPVTEKIN